MHRFGASGVLHILDDFLFIARTEEQCRTDLSNFLRMCDYLGVPIAQEKTCGPSQVIQFAGITLIQLIRKLVCRKIIFKNAAYYFNPFANVVKLLCENYSP